MGHRNTQDPPKLGEGLQGVTCVPTQPGGFPGGVPGWASPAEPPVPVSWGYLEPPVQGALDGDALAGLGPAGGDSGHERVQLVPLLLQLPEEALDGAAGEGLAVPSLPVAQQAVHDAGAAVTAQGHGAAALQGTA